MSRPAHRNRLAPIWAEEGLAEWVSMEAHPDQRSEATDDVLARVRCPGCAALISLRSSNSRSASTIFDLAYAEAWLACRYIADQYSEIQLGRFYAELDRGRSLDEASRSALKISEAELITRWRAYLVRLGASVGNRAAMNGGSMSRPRGRDPLAWGRDWDLRRGTTSSGSSAMRDRRSISARAVAMPTTLIITNDFPPRVGGIESFVSDVCALLDHDVVVYAPGTDGAAASDRERPFLVVRDGPLLLPTPRVAARATALLRAVGATR